MIICQKNGAVLRRINSISLGTEEISPRKDRCRKQWAFSARQDNAEWMNQRIHTIVINLTPIRDSAISALRSLVSVIDARCCKEHFVSRRRETDRICILNGQKGRKGRKKRANGERERGLRWPTEPQKQRKRWFRPQSRIATVRIEPKTGVELNERLESYQVQYEQPKKKGKKRPKTSKKNWLQVPPAHQTWSQSSGEKPQSNKKET